MLVPWRITLGERKCDHGWFAVHTHVSRHVPRIYQDDVRIVLVTPPITLILFLLYKYMWSTALMSQQSGR
jgi:hypothetical protein